MSDFDLNIDSMKSSRFRQDDMSDETFDALSEAHLSRAQPAFAPPDAGAPDDNGPEKIGAEQHIITNLNAHLPELYEFFLRGENEQYIRVGNLDKLRHDIRDTIKKITSQKENALPEDMVRMLSELRYRNDPDSIYNPFGEFLGAYITFRERYGYGENYSLPRILLDANKQKQGAVDKRYKKVAQINLLASRLSGYLARTFELLDRASRMDLRPWREQVNSTREAIKNRLFPVDPDTFDRFIVEMRATLSENKPATLKLNNLVHAKLWEAKSQKEKEHLLKNESAPGALALILQGITLTQNEASKLSASAPSNKPGDGQDEANRQLATLIAQSCDRLTPVVRVLQTTIADSLPSKEKPDDIPEAGTTQKIKKAKDVHTLADYSRLLHLPRLLEAVPMRLRRKANQPLARLTGLTREEQTAVLQAGWIIKDKLQQTRASLLKTGQAIQPLLSAWQHAEALEQLLAQSKTPVLDDELKKTRIVWKKKIDEETRALETSITARMELSHRNVRMQLQYLLADILREAQSSVGSNNILTDFFGVLEAEIDFLVSVEKQMEIIPSTANISEAHRTLLPKYINALGRELQESGSALNEEMSRLAGREPGSFSRTGMLAKGIAGLQLEWKREWLQNTPSTDPGVAEHRYDEAFEKIIGDYAPLLAKAHDGGGKMLLQRIRTERVHAATGNTLYPTTMAEMLRGQKGVEDMLKSWSIRRLVRKGLYAAFGNASFLPSLMALPLRIVIRCTITGAMVTYIIHKGQQGVTLGEGSVSLEASQYKKEAFKQVAIKIGLDAIPLASHAMGAAFLVEDIYKGRAEDAVKGIVKEVFTDLPLMAGYDVARKGATAAGELWQAHQFEKEMQRFLDGLRDEKNTIKTIPSATEELFRVNDGELVPLAKWLMATGNLTGIRMGRSEIGKSYYDLETRTVMLREGATDQEKLHEIAHALSAHQLRYAQDDEVPKRLKKEGRLEELKAHRVLRRRVKRLGRLHKKARKAYKQMGGKDETTLYYLSNLDEFVAGLYSGNDEFTSFLASIDEQGRSLLAQVVELLCLVLGLDTERDSALSRAMEISETIMRTPLATEESSHEGKLYHRRIDPMSMLNSFNSGRAARTQQNSSRPKSRPVNQQSPKQPPPALLPGWRKVGRINNSEMNVPSGKQVRLTLTHRDGNRSSLTIHIPPDKRAIYQWQHYVAHYINSLPGTLVPLQLQLGMVENGRVNPQHSSYKNDIYVRNDSDVSSVTWSFVDSSPSPINRPLSQDGNGVPRLSEGNEDTNSHSELDLDEGSSYGDLSDDRKNATYLFAIKQILRQIHSDDSLPKVIRDNAWLAVIGGNTLVPVDINGFNLNNTFFIPDGPGSKAGLLVCLDSEPPYYQVSKGSDLLENLKLSMPKKASKQSHSRFRNAYGQYEDVYFSGIITFNKVRRGEFNFERNFNSKNTKPMNIIGLASHMKRTIEDDYNERKTSPTNKMVMSRAILGSQIPEPDIHATPVQYRLELTWASMTPAQYLRGFARPFATLNGQFQLISSSAGGETVQETERNVERAEYIGSWADATVGVATAFTPTGWVIGTAQSVAEIVADLAENKEPDPLDVAGLILGSIPGGKIGAKIGKFSRVAGKTVKYGLLLGDKVVDLAVVARSIKTAAETGEPLAIFQALLASGMSVKSSYDMAKNMSLEIKLGKKMEDSASLEQLEALNNNAPEYSVSSNMAVRRFRIGQTELRGRINQGKIEISRDNGVNWVKGSALHLLAYRLQNAGGGSGWGGARIPLGDNRGKPIPGTTGTSLYGRDNPLSKARRGGPLLDQDGKPLSGTQNRAPLAEPDNFEIGGTSDLGARQQGRGIPGSIGQGAYNRPLNGAVRRNPNDDGTFGRGTLSQFPDSLRKADVDLMRGHIRLGTGADRYRGVYTDISVTPPKYYIKQDEHVFEVTFDSAGNTWRLDDSTAVYFNSDRGWEYEGDEIYRRRKTTAQGIGETYDYHQYETHRVYFPQGGAIKPNSYYVSGHGQSLMRKKVQCPSGVEIYFYTNYKVNLVDKGLSSLKNKPIGRVRHGKTEVPDGNGGWRDATEAESTQLTGSTTPGEYHEINLYHFEEDKPEGTMDLWKLQRENPDEFKRLYPNAPAPLPPESSPGIVTIAPGKESSVSGMAATLPDNAGASVTQLHVLACRGTMWSNLFESLEGTKARPRRIVHTNLSDWRYRPSESRTPGQRFTDSRPVTDTAGRVGIRAYEEIKDHLDKLPPKKKMCAGVAFSLLIAAPTVTVGILGALHDSDADETTGSHLPSPGTDEPLSVSEMRNRLESTITRITNLKDKVRQHDRETLATVRPYERAYFGQDELLSAADYEEIIAFLTKIKRDATDDELNKILSGDFPERLTGDKPAIFDRLGADKVMLFILNITIVLDNEPVSQSPSVGRVAGEGPMRIGTRPTILPATASDS